MENENQQNPPSQIRVAFIGISNSGKTALNDLTVIHPSMDKVKEHLKSEYNLEVIDEDILKLKEL